MHTLYRGQHLTESVPIECPPPNVIARHTPGPEKVGFAVRMDKLDYGAISIVLDNSGSMDTRHPKNGGKDKDAGPGEKSRFDYAVHAVKDVLRDIPAGTFVSISRFDKSAPQFIQMRPEKPLEESYLPWEHARWKSVETALNTMSPKLINNASPIANAIVNSMEKGFPPNFDQPKLIIVLTDGMDNYSSGEYPRKNDDEKTREAIFARNTEHVKTKLLNAKRNPEFKGIDVVVICFIGNDDDELPHAKNQFSLYADQGRLFFQADGRKLAQEINRVTRPLVQLRHKGKIVPGFEFGRPVDYAFDKALEWNPALDRGDYQAGILRSSSGEFDVNMASGHNIFAVLKSPENNKYVLERGVLGLQPEVSGKGFLKERKGDWLVTLLKDKKPFGDEVRQQLIAFEKAVPETGPIRQSQPGFVWLELETQDGVKLEQTLEWGNDLVVPAAAYAVEMAGWPGGNPKLTAWFWPRPWQDLLNQVKPIERRIDIKNFASRPEDLIESIRWETRSVGIMTSAAKTTKTEIHKECLVVRARYLDGKPVFVALKEKNDRLRVGSEHQFFHGAGKCTACFYDLPTKLEEVELVLIDVARFKDAAAQGGTKVEFAPRGDVDVPFIFHGSIIGAIHDK